jgi:PPOX class probable F420-dependent enzyme
MAGITVLSPADRAFLAAARSATLATIAPDGRPRLVPICFVVGIVEPGHSTRLYSPIDEKPKASSDARALARVRDLRDRPRATILAERWSEDWSQLGWIRLAVDGEPVEAGGGPVGDAERAVAIERLRAKYPQYAAHRLEHLPILRFTVHAVTRWGTGLSGPGTAPRRAAAGSGSSSSPGGSRPR